MDVEYSEKISIILRQTDLSYEDANTRLEKHKGDYVKVLEEYYGIKKQTSDTKTTINQQIYKEIRSVMDEAAFRFYSERENQNK